MRMMAGKASFARATGVLRPTCSYWRGSAIRAYWNLVSYLGVFLQDPLPEPSASMCSGLHNPALETAIGAAAGLAIATRHMFPNPPDGSSMIGSSDGIQADGQRPGTRRGEGHAIGEVYIRLRVLRKAAVCETEFSYSQSKLDHLNYWQLPR